MPGAQPRKLSIPPTRSALPVDFEMLGQKRVTPVPTTAAEIAAMVHFTHFLRERGFLDFVDIIFNFYWFVLVY
jgi:hypothetical protein